jgi:hypothetical protein
MQSHLIELSHEPPLVFVVLFLLSLVASYILFKLLDSRANIKRKGWSAGGAIAGFLLILFGSWFAVKPTLSIQRLPVPLSIPTGFKAVPILEAGIAIAIPDDWERSDTPITLEFVPKVQKPNSEDAKMMSIQISHCEELPAMLTEADLAKDEGALKQMFGLVHLRGASINDPYLGHKGSSTPISFNFPGSLMEPPRATDLTLNFISRRIYDERNGRCIALTYPDSELGRQLSSTLNIARPSP